MQASLRSRLLLNMAGSVLENAGLSLEFACGVPIIPGSAVKGAARRHALTLLRNTPAPEQPGLLSLILQVFGCTEEDFKTGDLKAWDSVTSENRKSIGRVSFLQAVPMKNPKLCCEILTPHHMEYMSGKRSRPYDDEPPVPNYFPAVEAEPDVFYSFALSITREEDTGLLRLAASWLRSALITFGVGAKGNAGYGLFTLSDEDKELAAKEETSLLHPIIRSSHLQFITPCFCTGGDSKTPEIRPASFRGELRWWFRCLGGSREREEAVFGAAADKVRNTTASAIQISVKDIRIAPGFDMRKLARGKGNSFYLTFFLIDQDTDQLKSFLPPGTSFVLEMRQMREINEVDKRLLMLAWDCMCHLGALGSRKNRAFGALAPYSPENSMSEKLMKNEIFRKFFASSVKSAQIFPNNHKPMDLDTLLSYCAKLLKKYRDDYDYHAYPQENQKRSRRKRITYVGPSVLGDAGPGDKRQSSAIRFRPYLRTDGRLGICILKAPIQIVVSDKARSRDIRKL